MHSAIFKYFGDDPAAIQFPVSFELCFNVVQLSCSCLIVSCRMISLVLMIRRTDCHSKSIVISNFELPAYFMLGKNLKK